MYDIALLVAFQMVRNDFANNVFTQPFYVFILFL